MITIGLVDIGNDSEMRIYFRQQYIDRLIEAGAKVLMIAPSAFSEIEETKKDTWIKAQLDACQGLLLPGGADINPAFWNAETESWCGEQNQLRDDLEQRLFLEAKKRKMPVLGICRGVQAINVFSGGSLYQDVNEEKATKATWHNDRERKAERVHGVAIKKDSILYAILGCEMVRVNSMHHQAVCRVADAFTVTAISEDGLIEGIEYTGDDWFCVGVQWHPEHMAPHCTEEIRLFEELIWQAKKD